MGGARDARPDKRPSLNDPSVRRHDFINDSRDSTLNARKRICGGGRDLALLFSLKVMKGYWSPGGSTAPLECTSLKPGHSSQKAGAKQEA